jgi:hypothetical protein
LLSNANSPALAIRYFIVAKEQGVLLNGINSLKSLINIVLIRRYA